MIDELLETIANAIEEYRAKKISEIDLPSTPEYEIYTKCQNMTKHIQEELEELDDDIDDVIRDSFDTTDIYAEDYRARQDELYSIDNGYYLTR